MENTIISHDHSKPRMDRAQDVRSMVSEADYARLVRSVGGMFDLSFERVERHPNNIKAVIKYK